MQQQCSMPPLPSWQAWPCVSTAIASGTTLAFCSWTHQVQTGCTGVSLSAQHSYWVPGKSPSVGHWHRISSAPPLIIQSATNSRVLRSKDQSAIVHLLLPLFASGIVYHPQLPLLQQSATSRNIWKLTDFTVLSIHCDYYIRLHM